MAGILDSVNQRTQLVGENRLEILMFRLTGRQLFAINVFKVQEVLQMPKLTLMPQRHRFVCGVVNLRGQTLPVIDLSQAIGMRPIVPDERSTIIVTEYNRSVPGALKNAIDVGSRPYGKSVWNGKPGAIVSCSPGAIGGACSRCSPTSSAMR